MTLVFGLTGGIASGKSTVTQMLKSEGVPMVDADLVARDIVRPGSDGLFNLVSVFGSDILTLEGVLDRPKLGEIVFSDPAKLALLDVTLGPLLAQEISNEVQGLTRRFPLVGVDAALLIEKGMHTKYQPVILVAVSEDIQLQRVMDRDHLDAKQAMGRIRSQMPLTEKIKHAKYVIWNDSGLEPLRNEVRIVLKDLLRLSGSV